MPKIQSLQFGSMAWRIDNYVVRGEIRNLIPGRVTGLVWLKGLNKPLELKLKGNCYRDLAGSTLVFSNPNAKEGDYTGLDINQKGVVGDITASKKVKIPAAANDDSSPGSSPFILSNCLYIEWFSEANGRVLIEATDYNWNITLPNWNLSEKEENQQRLRNQQAMLDFMDQLAQAMEFEEDDFPVSGEMNEFQWEAFLQKSDARSDMLMELFEKYGDDPKCENIVAEAMGWEVANIEYREELDEEWDDTEDDLYDDSESDAYLPNHPLISAMMDITSRIFFETESRKLLNGENSNPWNQLLWHSQLAVSKLIASLEEVAEGIEPERGFVIATLKRALHLVHLTIATLEAASSLQEKKEDWQLEIRKDLFIVRESILDLMQQYRCQ